MAKNPLGWRNIILFVCVPGLLFCAEKRESGGYASSYLRMPLSARSAGLGNAVGALADASEFFTENPAILGNLKERSVGSSVQFLSLDRSLHMVDITLPMPPTAGLALAWVHAGVANIEERNFANELTGTLQTSQDAFYLGFANQIIKNLTIGINAKIFLDQISEITATGFGLDLGAFYSPVDLFSLGFTIKDVNSKINWDTKEIYEFGTQRSDEFPTLYQVSGAFSYEDLLLVTATYRGSFDIFPTFHAGMEVRLSDNFAFRGGIDDKMPVVGFSTNYPVWGKILTRMDYAFLYGRYNEGISHAFSWIFIF
ncbi:MAG: hypothetical protein PHE86_00420 [Candidatus Marinimicrobia bacterium]|nr:hypothetical protein [Candidatus Neomarinimicrobiota bacterium]MDD5582005.1 hypothetical protein [Candidatus Neomarinimicrobiota bacterium]